MNGKEQPRVWIVLVNWNGWRDSLECLESVFRLRYPNFGVILCDNDSSDGSLEAIQAWASGVRPYRPPSGPLGHLSAPPMPKPIGCAVLENGAQLPPPGADAAPLLLVKTGGNLGFAGGNNVGIRLALTDPACDFVWLLNNDTVVDQDCLSMMVETARRDASTGITGSVNCFYAQPDVVQALGGGYFHRRRVFAGLHGHRLRKNDVTEAMCRKAAAQLDWVSGASMLVSRAFLESVGGMEERYFLYFEEIDWALRSEKLFKNALAGAAVLYHKSGSSTGAQVDSDFSIYTQYRSRFKLYRNLMPALLPVCYLRTLKDFLVATVRGKRVNAKAIWRASRDDLSQP